MSSNIDTSINVKLINENNENGGEVNEDQVKFMSPGRGSSASTSTVDCDGDGSDLCGMSPSKRKLWCKSKRWIFLLSCLCVILTVALIICFIKYRLKNYQDECCDTVTRLQALKSNNGSDCVEDDKATEEEEFYEYFLGNKSWNSSRLPSHLRPYYYNIDLRINVYEKRFDGTCAIRFKCVKAIPFIVIHSDSNLVLSQTMPTPHIYEIKEDPTSQTIKYQKPVEVKRMTYNAYFAYYVIELERDVFKKNRKYMIVFENYSSNITNGLKGIYYSSYTKNNQNRVIVVSQLQPLDARKVFPSFDEPIMKARFEISIEHHKEFTALSNMEEVSVEPVNSAWTRTRFGITPVMSTYILAFVVHDFKPIHADGPSGLRIRVWTRDDYTNNTKYALDIIPKAYSFFEKYFDIKEVVKKADHFAAPDFNAGAMENWGLVIYRESSLIFDQERSVLEDEYFVMLVICHEVSHSWFGNMATFKWWDDLWLNEAFANILMYLAMDDIRPDFNVMDTVVVNDIFTVMEKDSVETSHPVSTSVEDPNLVQQFFDEISYEKGQSVLRMLRGFIGDQAFKAALRSHINNCKFSNCDMTDLWNTMSAAVRYKFNVASIMTNWITQEGYPVVNVTRKIVRNKIVYDLKQEYFLLSKPTTVKNFKWVIPFTFKFQYDSATTNNLVWMNLSDNAIEMQYTGRNYDKWILGNLNFMGYYRVNYDEQNWKKIVAQLKTDHLVFSPTERAALIYDSFTLARVGYLDYWIPLEITSYLIKEQDYVPWKSFFKSVTYLDSMLSYSSCYGLFQEFCAKQISDIYLRLGWQDRGVFMERLLRAQVIKYATYFEVDDAVEKSKVKFEGYMTGVEKPEKHLVEAIYCAGVKYGTYKNWLYLYNKSKHSTPVEQNILWQALICNRDTWTLRSLLEDTLQENLFRRSDVRRIYGFFGSTPISRSVYFEFVTNKWNVLLKNYGNDAFIMGALLESLVVGINDEYSLERVQRMLQNGAGHATHMPSLVIEQINSNIKWTKSYERKICEYLAK